jgi:hypothetical protein
MANVKFINFNAILRFKEKLVLEDISQHAPNITVLDRCNRMRVWITPYRRIAVFYPSMVSLFGLGSDLELTETIAYLEDRLNIDLKDADIKKTNFQAISNIGKVGEIMALYSALKKKDRIKDLNVIETVAEHGVWILSFMMNKSRYLVHGTGAVLITNTGRLSNVKRDIEWLINVLQGLREEVREKGTPRKENLYDLQEELAEIRQD